MRSTKHQLNRSFVKIGAWEDEYEQHGPCCLYPNLTCFAKKACSIVYNRQIFRTDAPSSQHGPRLRSPLLKSYLKRFTILAHEGSTYWCTSSLREKPEFA